MADSENEFTVFYSWQSDLPDETNRRAIRFALRAASSAVETEAPKLRVTIDEATRGEAGSPNIPSTIQDKIKSCDAFVCDITTINSSAPPGLRRTPNPNVLFELGFAVAHVGWNRVVMLFNEAFGVFPTDAPFDIDRHRVSSYHLSAAEAATKSGPKALEKLAVDALKAIVAKSPPKPFSGGQQTPEEIRRQRDIANLKWAMAAIHLPTFDDMVQRLPRYLSSRAFHFWEGFNAVMTNPIFHVYDEGTRGALATLHEAWRECMAHGEQFHMAGEQYIFANPGDAPLDDEQERAWNAIDAARVTANEALDRLLASIRDRFLEIDIEEMNRAAWREYIEFQEKMDKRYGKLE